MKCKPHPGAPTRLRISRAGTTRHNPSTLISAPALLWNTRGHGCRLAIGLVGLYAQAKKAGVPNLGRQCAADSARAGEPARRALVNRAASGISALPGFDPWREINCRRVRWALPLARRSILDAPFQFGIRITVTILRCFRRRTRPPRFRASVPPLPIARCMPVCWCSL